MKQLIDILQNEGLTLVVKSADGTIHRFTQRGVKDLLALVTEHPYCMAHLLPTRLWERLLLPV